MPELVVYTGDYIYRESPCPAGNNGCKGTPWGDNQATWIVDWFQPSASVRAAAPLVITRGNHENCSRAGPGGFRYLDAHPFTGQCLDTTEPWAMVAGTVRIAVLDTNALKDARGQPLTPLFTKHLAKIRSMLDGPAWIATHRPFWGFGADDDTGLPVERTRELQDAVRKAGLSEDTTLLISAHLHLAQIVEFGGLRPPQLVIGNSGTELVTETHPPATIDGLPVTESRVIYQYGFATMEPETTGSWRLDFRDRSGRVILLVSPV